MTFLFTLLSNTNILKKKKKSLFGCAKSYLQHAVSSSPTRPLALGAWTLNHWRTREDPQHIYVSNFTGTEAVSYLIHSQQHWTPTFAWFLHLFPSAQKCFSATGVAQEQVQPKECFEHFFFFYWFEDFLILVLGPEQRPAHLYMNTAHLSTTYPTPNPI